MVNLRETYYSQTDKDQSIRLDPISDMRYKYTLSPSSFYNGLSSMVGLTLNRVTYLEGLLSDSFVSDREVVFDFSKENYLKPMPSSIYIGEKVTFKNTDILKHNGISYKDSYLVKSDILNKLNLQDREVYENLGITIPRLVKNHLKGESLTIPSYDFQKEDNYLYKFKASFNKPYMPMYFGYRENGYVNNYIMDLTKNTILDINLIESSLYYSLDYLKDVTSNMLELSSVGIMIGNNLKPEHISNVHYKLSFLTTRNHKRNSFLLADKNYSKLMNDVVDFKFLSPFTKDKEYKLSSLTIGKYSVAMANDIEDIPDSTLFLRYNLNPDYFRLDPVSYLNTFLLNNKVFLNTFMLDIGMSLDVREYLYIRDPSSCGYLSKEFLRLGYSYLNHHGALFPKSMLQLNVLKNKFFTDDTSITSKEFNNNSVLEESISKSKLEPKIVNEPLTSFTLNLMEDLKSSYLESSLNNFMTLTTDIYPYTSIPVFSKPLLVKNSEYSVNEYRYEGTFNNPMPIISSPLPSRSDINIYFNNTFRGGLGYSITTPSYYNTLFNGYEGQGFLNTISDSYSSLGNGTNYLIQRLKSRLSIALSINASYEKLSMFKDLIRYITSLGNNTSNQNSLRSILDPIDVQNFIFSKDKEQPVPHLYLPTERFNNIFFTYDSEIKFIKNQDVKVDITSSPTKLKVISILNNDNRYFLKHRITDKPVLQLRPVYSINKSMSGYITNTDTITKTYSDNGIDVEPFKITNTEDGVYFISKDTTVNFDNLLIGYCNNGSRVINFSGVIEDTTLFKNSRYENITSSILNEDSLLTHKELKDSSSYSFVDMEKVKGSNPMVRDIINLYNFKNIYTKENGCLVETSSLEEYSSFELSYNKDNITSTILPNKNKTKSILKNYIK